MFFEMDMARITSNSGRGKQAPGNREICSKKHGYVSESILCAMHVETVVSRVSFLCRF